METCISLKFRKLFMSSADNHRRFLINHTFIFRLMLYVAAKKFLLFCIIIKLKQDRFINILKQL